MPGSPIHRNVTPRDMSREPLLGPRSDMVVSRVLLEQRPDMDPKEADRLAVLINDALTSKREG